MAEAHQPAESQSKSGANSVPIMVACVAIILAGMAWFVTGAVILASFATLLTIKARTAFEIGRGAASVKRQKQYDRFLRIFIPAFLTMGVLASILGSAIFEFIWK